MPGMSRGGAMMPGQGGNTMAGDMISSMFGNFGQAPGPGQAMGGGRYGGSPMNNFGMGQAPTMNTPAIERMQQQCSGGDGYACNQLQILMARQQEQNSMWGDQYSKNMQGYNARTNNPMGAR